MKNLGDSLFIGKSAVAATHSSQCRGWLADAQIFLSCGGSSV
jgi:hypothetical protein